MDDLDLGVTIKGFAAGQKVFSRYSLKKILGRGGMGVVWLARDDTLEIDVALKFLPEVVAMDKEAIRDLKRETRRSLELTHPHIIRIYDFVQDGRAAAISMEFVAGDTLAARKADRAGRGFEPAEIERWVQQLCEALGYAHERALVVHRDLKPANLMVDAHGDLKIADFGIAASVSDSVSRVSVRAGSSGTPVYMSPQQMMGDKPAVTDDIYSVGATLYDLVTGRPPFFSGNIIAQVQGKTPPRMADRRAELERERGVIPESWEQTVAACLAKEAKDRPQRAAEILTRLRAAIVAEPPPLPKAKPVEMRAAPPVVAPPAKPPPPATVAPAAAAKPPPPPPPKPAPEKAAPVAVVTRPPAPAPEQAPVAAKPAPEKPVAETPPEAKAVVTRPVQTAEPVGGAATTAEPMKPEAPSRTSSLKYNPGGEVSKPKAKAPTPAPAPVAKVSSTVRYAPGGDAPVAKKSPQKLYAMIAAAVVVVGVGFYFVGYRPAAQRAAAEAAATTARTEMDRAVTAVRFSLGAGEWEVAAVRLGELDRLAGTWPADVAAQAAPVRLELQSELDRGREAARVAGLRVPVILSSTPAGAEVLVGGTSRGVTPWTGELPLGDHAVTLRLKDHVDLPAVLQVREAGQKEWSWPLVRARGWLQLAGLPTGAGFRIFPVEANGAVARIASVEGRLPTERLQLPVGTYEVVVASAGSGPEIAVRSRLVVRRDETISHNADVRGASVRLTSTPAGATVLLNGRVEGTTPLLLTSQPYGARQEIELRREGYEVLKQVVVFPASADQTPEVALKLPELSGPRLRPDFIKGPARLMVESRARNSMTMRTTVNGQTTTNGPTESTANSRDLFNFSEPGPNGTWQRAQAELVEAPGFQAGTVVQFSRASDRWVARFTRGGFAAGNLSTDYLYPSYAGLALVPEALPDGRPTTGRAWEVPPGLARLVLPGSGLESPTGSIRGRVKSADQAAAPAWAEVEYAFDISGRVGLGGGGNDGGPRDMQGREVGTLTVRLDLESGVVSQARLDKRTTVSGSTAASGTTPGSTFTSEIITSIESSATIPAAPSTPATPADPMALFTRPGTGSSTPAIPGPATGRPDATIYELAQVDRAPRPRVQTPPDYPAAMQRASITGSVRLEFVVDETGAVRHARALESSHREFEAPAIAAVLKWKFHPAEKNGRPSAVRIQTLMEFSLD